MIDQGTFTVADRTTIIRALFDQKREEVACGLVDLAIKAGVSPDSLSETCDRVEQDQGRGVCQAVKWVRARLVAHA